MNPPLNREVALFSAALELDASQRSAYLDENCADDPALRHRLEELLRVHEDAITFLENKAPGGPVSAEAEVAGGTIRPLGSLAEKPGDHIGRYKLLQQLGEGGCGVVYMAEQEEPVRRRVALKVIKLGMDTKQVIARFEAERQALALMDHPNIAKVFDAGVTGVRQPEDEPPSLATRQSSLVAYCGRPFFVMELVRGVKITDYCDENQLTAQERLGLFIQVCQAIQHAHQKGVIHRDIKPSNILVTVNDGLAVPKVIDFGIAKATQGRLTDQTLFTAFEQFIGTPAYMSPEQASMTSLDIDTRSDVYSLGVLLYELLTSRTPFDQKVLLAGGLDEMRRTIREREPPRPSTRLSTMLQAELTAASQRRQLEPLKLIHLLRGDLDWIVMKCLEKDRTRRYATANALVFDIQRHLNDEPVLARPPSRVYRMRKMVQRNKAAFAAGIGVAGVVLAGLVVSTSLFISESKAHRRASTAEQAAEAGRRAEATSRQRAEQAEQKANEELWHAYLAQARATRVSGQPGRRFDSLDILAKAAAIRFDPGLRDEAIACLALSDLRLERRLEVKLGVFDRTLERYAVPSTNLGNISIRRVKDDQEISVLPNPPGTVGVIGSFSHSGQYLPVFCRDHQLRVWDLKARSLVLTVPCATRHESVDFRPDDECVAVAAGRAEVSIYDMSARGLVSSIPTPFAAACVRYDPSGQKLAISSFQDNRLVILDALSGSTLTVLTNGSGLDEIAWNPHDSTLAVAAKDGLIYLWETDPGRPLRALRGHQGEPGNVAFNRDGRILISCGWDGTHLWNARAGEHLVADSTLYGALQSFAAEDTVYGHSEYGPAARLELMSFASGREACLWQADEGNTNSIRADHNFVAFSADGRWLAFAGDDAVRLFDARTCALLGTLPIASPEGVCFQKSGCGLLVSGERGLFRWPIREADKGSQITIGPPEAVGEEGPWGQASLSENGQVFAAFHGDHVCTFEAEGMRQIACTPGREPESQNRFISLSPDGQWLATGGWHDTAVRIWKSRTGALIKEITNPEWYPEASPLGGSPYPAFSPDGRSLIITCWESYRIWKTESWAPGTRFPRSEPDYLVMAISHDGEVVAMRTGQNSIQLREVATGKVLATLRSPIEAHPVGVAFSPDDSQLATIHYLTRALVVWDLRLIREELAKMHFDWERPPYPPPVEAPTNALHFHVLTRSS